MKASLKVLHMRYIYICSFGRGQEVILTSDFYTQMFLIVVISVVYSLLAAEGFHLLYVA